MPILRLVIASARHLPPDARRVAGRFEITVLGPERARVIFHGDSPEPGPDLLAAVNDDLAELGFGRNGEHCPADPRRSWLLRTLMFKAGQDRLSAHPLLAERMLGASAHACMTLLNDIRVIEIGTV